MGRAVRKSRFSRWLGSESVIPGARIRTIEGWHLARIKECCFEVPKGWPGCLSSARPLWSVVYFICRLSTGGSSGVDVGFNYACAENACFNTWTTKNCRWCEVLSL